MRTRSRRYRNAAKKVDPARAYPLEEALGVVQSFDPTKFDETVEISIHLGIDPKKTDQLVRGAVSLPRGLGRDVRVIVFAEAEAAEEAKTAGAIAVGTDDLAKRIQDGWTEFDVAITTPDQMKVVGRLGKILGPQGKMPSPKSGTVTADVGRAVREFRAGKVEFRTDAGGNLHAPIGKRSFPLAHLLENANTLLDAIRALRPAAAKGVFLERVVVSATMSPGVLVAAA
jgi:large subunit ribosomal protein L1